jgi:hypothetical protein
MSARLVIVGGSDAGISAGLRAKELDPGCKVTIVVADRFPNYSICGLPFYLSGEVPEWRALAHRTIEELSGLLFSSITLLFAQGNVASWFVVLVAKRMAQNGKLLALPTGCATRVRNPWQKEKKRSLMTSKNP